MYWGGILMRLFLSVPCVLLMVSTSQLALAQEASTAGVAGEAAANAAAGTQADKGGIQDIVVTAERREQSVQRSPLTIQVIGGEEVTKAGLSNVEDLTRLVTGVQIGNGGGQSQIYVRGVGDFSYSVLASPGVAFNIDGVYVGRPNGVNGNFFDVSRVEVLKGPQGTLYGRNANGGSINLITNDPKIGVSGGYVSGEIGNYGLQSITGAVNAGLSDSLAARIAFRVVDRSGYLSDGSSDDVQQAIRFKAHWDASPDITLKFSADWSHLGGNGAGYVYTPKRPGASPWEGTSDPAAVAYRGTLLPPELVPVLTAPFDKRLFQDSTLWNASIQLDANLGFATLTVIPAYRDFNIQSTANTGFTYDSYAKGSQKTMEMRLGDSSPGLTWVVGGFFFNESINGYNGINMSDIVQNTANFYRPRATSVAAFGQATLPVSDSLRLIGGLRYTYEKRKLDGSFNDVRCFCEYPGTSRTFYPLPSEINPVFPFFGRKSFNALTYKVGAEYDVGPQSMLYATFSTGFKAGGLNQTAAQSRTTYDPEKLRAFEAGIKNRFLDNKLQLNLSGFYWKYKDIQNQNIEILSDIETNFLFANVGDATLYGGTLDLVARPWEGSTFSTSIEYTHSRYDKFETFTPTAFYNPAAIGCPIDREILSTVPTVSNPNNQIPVTVSSCAGFQVARVPKWSGSASYQQDFDMGDAGRVSAVGSMQFASARWYATDFIPAQRDAAYAVFNANIDYTTANDRFSIGAFIRNIGKTAYYTGGIVRPFVPGLSGSNVSEPRVYGLRATVKFGGQ